MICNDECFLCLEKVRGYVNLYKVEATEVTTTIRIQAALALVDLRIVRSRLDSLWKQPSTPLYKNFEGRISGSLRLMLQTFSIEVKDPHSWLGNLSQCSTSICDS